ncbi:MAG: hypothetical protein ACLP1Y_05130 [Candidatus Acidiferrales bacterium]
MNRLRRRHNSEARTGRVALALLLLFFSAAAIHAQTPAAPATNAQAGEAANALASTLSAACREDWADFATHLTAESAQAFRGLPATQRTALMQRMVQLDEAGKPLLSTSSDGYPILRCGTPTITTEMHFGATQVRENLAFISIDVPSPGEGTRSIRFGMVREGGDWKLLSVGLLLLDIPTLEQQWERSDLEAREEAAVEDLRDLAHALDTYRNAFGLLPDSLAQLGPAPKEGISSDAAGLIDAQLAAGSKDGYTFRYRIVPAVGAETPEDANKKSGFEIAATPYDYGKTGKRSFFLDSSGVLRGADKQGVVATADDPRLDSPLPSTQP